MSTTDRRDQIHEALRRAEDGALRIPVRYRESARKQEVRIRRLRMLDIRMNRRYAAERNGYPFNHKALIGR